MAERLERLTIFYWDGVRRLETLAKPDLPARELDAYADITTACFVGLGHRTAFPPSGDVAETSETTARLMMRGPSLPRPTALR